MVSVIRLFSRSGSIHWFTVCILGLAVFGTSCKSDRSAELLGTWQATVLLEEGDTVDVILDDVGLYFDETGKYIYTSTLDYQEAGTFRAQGQMLYTTPEGQDTLKERPVAIQVLSDSSLHLNMKEGNKNRILEFVRAEANPNL